MLCYIVVNTEIIYHLQLQVKSEDLYIVYQLVMILITDNIDSSVKCCCHFLFKILVITWTCTKKNVLKLRKLDDLFLVTLLLTTLLHIMYLI